MDLNEFNDEFVNPLIEKIATDNKKLFLVGDFNIDLLKVDLDPPTNNIFDIITTNLLVPHNKSYKDYIYNKNFNRYYLFQLYQL